MFGKRKPLGLVEFLSLDEARSMQKAARREIQNAKRAGWYNDDTRKSVTQLEKDATNYIRTYKAKYGKRK
jgi:hypothetical protein